MACEKQVLSLRSVAASVAPGASRGGEGDVTPRARVRPAAAGGAGGDTSRGDRPTRVGGNTVGRGVGG